MDLTTRYLGFGLPHPLIPGASPLGEHLDTVRALEDCGAPMIVLPSLFEEQITAESLAINAAIEEPAGNYAEALSYFADPPNFELGPHEYLEHIGRVKAAVDIPVVASLNGSTPGGWLEYAALLQQAGADALELNVYYLATDPQFSAAAVEDRTVDMVRGVKQAVGIPVAVKLSPFYTSLPHLAARLDEAGADALVLFNRFYQPDIDLEELEVERSLRLSDSSELLLRLRWLAILCDRVRADLAVTGGVHEVADVVKAVMCGATGVQMASALLRHGALHVRKLSADLAEWLESHEYESLDQMRGSMSLRRSPDPSRFERANYMTILQSWKSA